MNALQLKLRNAAIGRNYVAIDECFAAGLRAEHALDALLPDVVRTLDAKLFEIALCSSPIDTDLDMVVRRISALGADESTRVQAAAMYLRSALLAKFRCDHMRDDFDDLPAGVPVSVPTKSMSNVVSLSTWSSRPLLLAS